MTIEISSSTILWAILGGLIIGTSASLLLLLNGRIAGISGIANRILAFEPQETLWRSAFIIGLICGGFFLAVIFPEKFSFDSTTPFWRLALAGLLVGFGTSLGKGCTSGHGICGISRLSKRSIAATILFMICGFMTVFFMRFFGVIS